MRKQKTKRSQEKEMHPRIFFAVRAILNMGEDFQNTAFRRNILPVRSRKKLVENGVRSFGRALPTIVPVGSII